jgi:hypothetical protein
MMASGPTVHLPNFKPVLPRTQKSLLAVSNRPSIANGNCVAVAEATRPKKNRPGAIFQLWVTDRAVATEEITAAVWGRRHGKVEADADKIPTKQPARLVKITVQRKHPAAITGRNVLLEVAADPHRARGAAAFGGLLLRGRLAHDNICGPCLR